MKRDDVIINLTAKEFQLLEYLLRNKNRVVSRADIAINVWDIDFDSNTNIIDVYINYIRNKVDKPFPEKLIQTQVGMGYVLERKLINMPIRLRITLLFTLAAFIILGIVSIAVYYFSASSRITTIKTRLMNRAITTSRLLSQSAAIDPILVHRIDSLTTLSLKHKSVQAYDKDNWNIYYYSDSKNERINIDSEMLAKYRENTITFFNGREKGSGCIPQPRRPRQHGSHLCR